MTALIVLLAAATWGSAGASVRSIERVSQSGAGETGNQNSILPSISENGRFIAFESDATNLVANDTNASGDIFVRDLVANTTQRVSVSSGGVQGNNRSRLPDISADGRYVAFLSAASNLVAGDTNGLPDIFVHDRQTGQTQRVSLRSDDTEVPAVEGEPLALAISGNGRVVAMQHMADLIGPSFGLGTGGGTYIRDLDAGVTERIALKANGSDAVRGNSCSISDDGRFVAFDSFEIGIVSGDQSPNLDVFVRDRQANTTSWITPGMGQVPGTGNAMFPRITPDGRFVVFESDRTDLVPADTNDQGDIFIHDRQSGTTERVSVGAGGVQANDVSGGAASSSDGRMVVFSTTATNLVAGDTNGQFDVFVRDRQLGTTERLSLRENGDQSTTGSAQADLSGNGLTATFVSKSLLSGAPDNFVHIFAVEFGDAPPNQAPTAVAGPDQTIKSKAAKAKVILDGSGSSDPDNDKLTYRWLEGKTQIATGVKPTVRLKKGVHTITLEVGDPGGLTDSDEVVITVKKKKR